MLDKPFSPSCERNQAPILEKLRQLFDAPGQVLEIGSGTGQHAVYFGSLMPHLIWQTSDLPDNHPGITAWLNEAALDNVLLPVQLDVLNVTWPVSETHYAFTANTAHIMPWPAVAAMIRGVGTLLAENGRFVVYGPFKYAGRFTSDSNEAFDGSLRRQNEQMGIRDFEAVCEVAMQSGMQLTQDMVMPANNQMLVFERQCATGAHGL